MKIGVLVTGDTAVRAAHSLSAHPGIESVVVIGPARSKSFDVVAAADDCDYLIGTGPDAIKKARKHGRPLIWDGENPAEGVAVYGASPPGLAVALAARESDPRVVAVAHPDVEGGHDHVVRFPDPVGQLEVKDATYGGRRLAMAEATDKYAACIAIGAERRVTVIDEGPFMAGIALAAGVSVVDEAPRAVWDDALDYLRTATEMGLVMGAA